MKEELVSLLVSKVGLDQQKAETAIETILEYCKNNPEQTSSLLGKLGGGLGGKLGGMLGG